MLIDWLYLNAISTYTCIGSFYCYHLQRSKLPIWNIYNGIIFPSLNPAKIFQFISRWTESTKSSALGPDHMRSDYYIKSSYVPVTVGILNL